MPNEQELQSFTTKLPLMTFLCEEKPRPFRKTVSKMFVHKKKHQAVVGVLVFLSYCTQL